MPGKKELLHKLMQKTMPHNFTVRELDTLMSKCGCEKYPGGRGSALSYFHVNTKRILRFDGPHPGNELYPYQVKMVRKFLAEVHEI